MTPHPVPGQPAGSSNSRRPLPQGFWLPVAGVLLAVGGIVLLAQGPGAVNVGWVAYTPLPQDGLPGGLMLYSRSMLAGALLVLTGAVLLAFWAGLEAGRRRPRSGSRGTGGRCVPPEPPAGPDNPAG